MLIVLELLIAVFLLKYLKQPGTEKQQESKEEVEKGDILN